MSATLLVIGGSGFFGRSILDAYGRGKLAPWGIDKVIAVGRHRDHFMAVPQLHYRGVEFLAADVASVATLPAADFVIHAAASTDAVRYRLDPEAESRNVQTATENYCRIARHAHRASKIVYVSSGAVYGAQAATSGGWSEDDAEDDVALAGLADGKRDYARAKRQSEQMVRALAADGAALCIARCFAFVGPWLPRDQHFAIGNFIADGLHGRSVALMARHPVYRSYMHADDLVTWLMTMAAHATPACPVYNLGSPEAVLLSDVARMVAARCGVAAAVPAVSELTVDRYVPSVAKAMRELGLSLEYDLAAALDVTLAVLGRYPVHFATQGNRNTL